MEQQINAMTIAATDLAHLKEFYIKVFGWIVHAENDKVVMFRLNGIMLTLCTEELFRSYTGINPGLSNNKGSYYTINFSSVAIVDEQFNKLEIAGSQVIKRPTQTFWGGYSGFAADPENNIWEICYNPIPGTQA